MRADGTQLSSEEVTWTEISRLVPCGGEQLYLLTEPAVLLVTSVGGKQFMLRAPSQRTYFFRHYKSRAQLGGGASELLYYALGYVSFADASAPPRAGVKVTLEIDARGHAQLRAPEFLAANDPLND